MVDQSRAAQGNPGYKALDNYWAKSGKSGGAHIPRNGEIGVKSGRRWLKMEKSGVKWGNTQH